MDIQKIIDYLLHLETEYQWSTKNRQSLEKDLHRLSDRMNDKCLYLGVTGEFSSGKSTLINALLGQHLLKEDVLQGTTCAPTFLRFGKEFDVVIEFTNGDIQSLSLTPEFRTVYQKILKWFKVQKSNNKEAIQIPQEFAEIQRFIDKHTAEETTAKNIKRTTIYLNNPILQSGWVIVDTPGINADNPRHGIVAENAIKEYCDAVILLVPATEPCSEVLCDFVRNHLQGIQSSSVAIVTKIDNIREWERKDVLDYVRKRLNNETKTEFADVLSCASLYALGNDPESPLSDQKQEEFREQFCVMRKEVMRYLKNSREKIINRKLYQILINLIPQLKNHLQKKQKEYRDRKNILAQSRLKDLGTFIYNRKIEFREHCKTIKINPSSFEIKIRRNIFDWIDQKIGNAGNRQELEENVKLFEKEIQKKWGFLRTIIDDVCRQFYNEADQFYRVFKEKFYQEYRSLNKIYTQPSTSNALSIPDRYPHFFLSSNLSNLTEKIIQEKMLKVEFFIPGIGPLIMKTWFAQILVNLFISQKEMNRKMVTSLRRIYYEEVERRIQTRISDLILDHKVAAQLTFENCLDSFKQIYGPQIAQMVRDEQEDQRRLQTLIGKAEWDLNYLEANERNIRKYWDTQD